MITLNNVSLSFGDREVIKKFSYTFPETGIVAITGPSGCGKTTLLRILCGFETPDSGQISGVPQKISYVFQEHRLIPWISAIDNVATIFDNCDKTKAKEILNKLGITDEDAQKLPSMLSGGMKQRVSIARALYNDASLYLLDEPFSALDAENRDTAMSILKKKAENALLIIVSHNLEDIVNADLFIRMELNHENN